MTSKKVIKLSDIVDIPIPSEVISFHKSQMKLSKLKQASQNQLEALDIFKHMHGTPKDHGLFGKDLRLFLEPSQRKKLGELSLPIIDMYIEYYKLKGRTKSASEFVDKVLPQLNQLRKKRIISVIESLDSAIYEFGVAPSKYFGKRDSKFQLFRVMNQPYSVDKNKMGQIQAISSWSIYPLFGFCKENECYLYIIDHFDKSVEKQMKLLYLEKQNQQLVYWEFEFVMPRGVIFKILSTSRKRIEDPNFRVKIYTDIKKNGIIVVNVIHIAIVGINQIDLNKIDMPKIDKIQFGS